MLLSLVVSYFVPSAPEATKGTRFYARHILKYNQVRSSGMLPRNCCRLGQILVDEVAIGSGKVDQYRFEFERHPEFLQLLNSGQGVIMIGAHVGNWEIGVPFFDGHGKKINIVTYDAKHRRIEKMSKKNGQDRGFKITPINKDNLIHVFRITKTLNKRKYICFQGDRYLDRERLLTGTLLGQKAPFPAGPSLPGSRMRVPVVLYFAMREPGRTHRFHSIRTRPAIRAREKKTKIALLEQHMAALGQVLKRRPEQWFGYYSFWKITSNGSSSRELR